MRPAMPRCWNWRASFGSTGQAQAQPAVRVVVGALARALCRLDLVCGPVRARPRRELHRPGQHRLARLRWATEYTDISWMSETAAFCKKAIRTRPQSGDGERAHQRGTIRSTTSAWPPFTCSLDHARDAAKGKGYYAVGGCGGNIAWHTENDRFEVADKDILMKTSRRTSFRSRARSMRPSSPLTWSRWRTNSSAR